MGAWITEIIESMGYAGIMLLAILENVFPPIPSELIMPLAGFLVAKGSMSMAGAIAAGCSGSVIGALLLYALGWKVGEERLKLFADRHGRWLTLSRHDIESASAWFERRGTWAVFVCRLIPGMRSLISIPAGLQRMNLFKFIAATALGALGWTSLLVYLGYVLGENFERVGAYLGPVSKIVLAIIVLAYAWRVWRHKGTSAAN